MVESDQGAAQQAPARRSAPTSTDAARDAPVPPQAAEPSYAVVELTGDHPEEVASQSDSVPAASPQQADRVADTVLQEPSATAMESPAQPAGPPQNLSTAAEAVVSAELPAVPQPVAGVQPPAAPSDACASAEATTNDEAGAAAPVPSAAAPTAAANTESLTGKRVREIKTTDRLCPRHGLVFVEQNDEFAVAFDDLYWRHYKVCDFSKHLEFVPFEFDMDDDAIRSVLIGRQGALNLASGFLLSSSPIASAATPTGWEAFQKYVPAPIKTSPARYANPPVDVALSMGDPILIAPPFVSLAGTKVGVVNPSSSFTGRVVCLLLGGTWNATRQRTDKRRWVLVEHNYNFYLVPLDDRLSAGSSEELPEQMATAAECHEFALKMTLDRTPGSVNNLHQAAQTGYRIHLETAKLSDAPNGASD
eukprot:5450960-Pleurochrysis_carterae.AAC.1